ncbi:hypothetical protein I5U77_03020 [Stenotrophomonas maltophilia]|nr:hypothetical protein [Stenotrophomonas maltophilia]
MNPSAAIELLRDAGMTEKAIGAQVGAGQSTINKIRRGQMQPTYEVGRALVDLAISVQRKAARRGKRQIPAPGAVA